MSIFPLLVSNVTSPSAVVPVGTIPTSTDCSDTVSSLFPALSTVNTCNQYVFPDVSGGVQSISKPLLKFLSSVNWLDVSPS